MRRKDKLKENNDSTEIECTMTEFEFRVSLSYIQKFLNYSDHTKLHNIKN